MPHSVTMFLSHFSKIDYYKIEQSKRRKDMSNYTKIGKVEGARTELHDKLNLTGAEIR